MTMQAIERFLLETIGLDSESIGNTVQRTVAQRMRAVGVQHISEYLSRLKQDPRELQGLIDSVTVPETWFFRDKEPFHMLAQLVRTRWLPPSRSRPLRILSLPCATGEEPYSIAMVLRELGFSADEVRIDAVDISQRALERAQGALYGANSFRGDEGHFQAKYFDKTAEGYVLHDAIKRMVNFRHGNLLNDIFLAGTGLYEIIFCRNVLIYFSRAQQERAIVKLHRLLTNDGVLFVGHAEGGRLLGDYFASLKQAGTFAFQRRDRRSETVEAAPAVIAAAAPAKAKPVAKAAPPPKRRVSDTANELAQEARASLKLMQTEGDAAPSVLEEVQRLADLGSLSEAAALCEAYLVEHNVSADGYYLLGLIRQAEGKDNLAAELFRKAVYLDARHYQALVHLAAQAEYTGNSAAAAVYRARASRLVAKK